MTDNNRKYNLSLSHFEVNVLAGAIISHESQLHEALKKLDNISDREVREGIRYKWKQELEALWTLEERLDDVVDTVYEQEHDTPDK